ncbi:MAG: hypothetical protein JRI96_15200 [Deltaproteobacteria bacterium]|nr:hypothetical protein [Deltaproteobacteria bacterium]
MIYPAGEVEVEEGQDQTFSIYPSSGFKIADVLVDGESVGAVSSYTFGNVTRDHTIQASFAVNAYTITATAGAGGTITPSGAVAVNSGDDQSFTITADTGYGIADVLVDGVSVGAVAGYEFTDVVDNHTIEASFEEDLEEVFGLYTATLDGNNMQSLITDSYREMTHARVSPNGEWVTFSRYNTVGNDGYATEEGGYLNTEIVVMKTDGSVIKTVAGPAVDKMSVNSYWTPHGEGLVYIYAPNNKGLPQINHITFNDNMEVEKTSKIPIPEHIAAVDPHWVGDWIVFSGIDIISKTRGIWRIRYNGEDLQLLAETPDLPSAQDNDPKLSPDGTKVAFMRFTLDIEKIGEEGVHNWHTYVMDADIPFSEVDISAQHYTDDPLAIFKLDGLPEWIDNEKLLVWYRDLINKKHEIHTMNYDGSERQKVPLPDGFDCSRASVFPQEDSGEITKIIFSTRRKDVGPYEKINIIGDRAPAGIYDPSVEYGEDGIGWMAYSGVTGGENACVDTHLAKTTNHGETWEFTSNINPGFDDSILEEGQIIEGRWRYEVASILYDPDDPGREWKLFTHRFFTKPPYERDDRIFKHGWFAYKYASDPAGPWSDEIPLLGAGQFVTSYYNVKIDLNSLSPELEDIKFYSEPGTVYKDGVIYLSMEGYTTFDCFGGTQEEQAENWLKHRTVLFASYDHGESWEYLGKLTGFSDSYAFGYLIFTASSLVEENGRQFLLLSPSGKLFPPFRDDGRRGGGKAHDGTFIFEFEDIAEAKLKRAENGKLVTIKYIEPLIGTGGQSDYDEQNTYGGIVLAQENHRGWPYMQIYNTKEKIVGKIFILGNVSGDGSITTYDASLVARYAVGFIDLTPEQIDRADVDGDGYVTEADAELIARKAVDPAVIFPAE